MEEEGAPGHSGIEAVPPATDLAVSAPARRGLFGPRKVRKPRAHPYVAETSPAAETDRDASTVTLGWAVLALVLVGGGYLAASAFSPLVPGASRPFEPSNWNLLLKILLFSGIGLLAFSFVRQLWATWIRQAGWLIGALYGGLWAQDLFYAEAHDYVNALFSMIFGIMFVYLAYHEWLSRVRGVNNVAVRFLGVAWFVGAGAYFLIDKVQPVRLWLIHVVSQQTKWFLDLFGQGDQAGLVFLVNEADNKSPTTFFYPSQYCDQYNSAIPDVAAWCAERGIHVPMHSPLLTGSWWQDFLLFAPDGDLAIKPVSIILACTALQSIMVFVGLFAGTTAPLQRKIRASLIVGVVVYILNLIRNTGIIWFYGQGHASFWMMHDAIGKGGSLIAMIGIAFGVFRWFPEFFQALVGVLDLVERDGPIERTLKIGRRRPSLAPVSDLAV